MAVLTSDGLIELRAGPYSARIAPGAGGRVAALTWLAAGHTQPLLVEWDGAAFDEHAWPKAGAFAMLPFANRLSPAGFMFNGRVIRPDPGPAGFAQHGIAHRRRWDVVLSQPDRVVMQFRHPAGDAGWPWAWRATQDVRLALDGLTTAIAVQNESGEPMPLSLGWHPYHPLPAPLPRQALVFGAQSRHDLDHDGAASQEAGEPVFAMRQGETAAFSGWRGRLSLRTNGSSAIAIACEGGAHLVLHRPVAGDYLCVEPVTAVPGSLARVDALWPKQVQRLSWSCWFEPGAAWEGFNGPCLSPAGRRSSTPAS